MLKDFDGHRHLSQIYIEVVWRHTRKLDGLRNIFYDSKDDYICGITIIRVRVDVCGTDFASLVSIYSELRIT